MFKIITAFTSEIDDPTQAVADILAQIPPESDFLENTVGMLTCYAEFVESGAVAQLCDALPFDVVGSTTLGSAMPGSDEMELLTLTVLTGDDVHFATGLSAPITANDDATPLLREAYEAAAAKLGEKPALMISNAPLHMSPGGDFFVHAFDEITGGVPNFGAICVDHNENYSDACVIYNGVAYPDRYAFVLVGGNVEVRFSVASLASKQIFPVKGVVTASSGNQLQTVDNVPVGQYLVSLGLPQDEDGNIQGVNSFPFIVDYNDGTTPVLRAIFALTPEGYAVCGGDIPVGATLSVGSIDSEAILTTTRQTLSDIVAQDAPDFLLAASCVGRYFSLGYSPTDEIEAVRKALDGTGIPYQFSYAGGELCPVYEQSGSTGDTANRCHNDSCIFCALYAKK